MECVYKEDPYIQHYSPLHQYYAFQSGVHGDLDFLFFHRVHNNVLEYLVVNNEKW